ncbi:MAG: MFS transporter [Ilumatobacter sp.]|uniref:MFS transporter n=1 Tax=Ilumatobacter sp. TaxID=1967498 RepID=UPI001DACFEE3|nr:MFS transporter [Ilumatobacter sp.]
MSEPMVDPNAMPEPGRDAWMAVGVTTLVFFLVVIDVAAVNVAFPSIRDDFEVSDATLGWVISGYNITVASLLMVAGRYADSLGRKRLFLPGVAIFMLGSMLSGLAPSAGLLIAARVVQGVGGAIISPTAIAVVLPAFPAHKRSTVIGITGATGALGAVAGPALGAFITDAWSWRGIFLINVPLCLIVLAIAPKLLTESKDPAATGRVDLLGVPLGTAGVAAVMFAIVRSESAGLTDPTTVALFIVGIALIAALVRRSAHQDEPLIELDLFRHRSFSSTNLGLAFYSMAFTSGFLVNSLLLQELWGQSLVTTGAALMLSPLIAAAVSPFAGRWADRVGHRWILTVGSLCCAAGYLGYRLVLTGEPAVWNRFVPMSVLVGIGVGATIATWASAGLADVEPAKFGTSNAMIRTTQQVFYALGISVAIAIISRGVGDTVVANYHLAWWFVSGCYAVSALVVAMTFPSGSSRSRVA